jgi:DNA-binding GntR family transcriptional regulator
VVADLDELLAAMEEALTDGDVLRYLDVDEEILMTLYQAAGNPVLEETIQSLWIRCRHYKILGARKTVLPARGTVPPELVSRQRELVTAARNGDGDAAATISTTSLDEAMERIRTSFSAD